MEKMFYLHKYNILQKSCLFHLLPDFMGKKPKNQKVKRLSKDSLFVFIKFKPMPASYPQ